MLLKASACELCLNFIPQKEKNLEIYSELIFLIKEVKKKNNLLTLIQLYITWETKLLNNLGYGLDFSKCAVTGATENLSYVSPKTGQVVCSSVGEPWKKKLLKLPEFMHKNKPIINKSDVRDAFGLNYFLLKKIMKNFNFNKNFKLIYREQIIQKVLNIKNF